MKKLACVLVMAAALAAGTAWAEEDPPAAGTYSCSYKGKVEAGRDVVIHSSSTYADVTGATGEFQLYPEGFEFFSGPLRGYGAHMQGSDIILQLPGTGRELTCTRPPG